MCTIRYSTLFSVVVLLYFLYRSCKYFTLFQPDEKVYILENESDPQQLLSYSDVTPIVPISNPISPSDMIDEAMVKRLFDYRRSLISSCGLSFEAELDYFLRLIETRVPMVFIRFGDGGYAIASGIQYAAGQGDGWKWGARHENNTLRVDMVNAMSHTDEAYFVGCHCASFKGDEFGLDWMAQHTAIDKFHMSYRILWSHNNYQRFCTWFVDYISNSTERQKRSVVAIAGRATTRDAQPIPSLAWANRTVWFGLKDVHDYERKHLQWKSEMVALAQQYNYTLFVLSLGPMAKVFAHHMWRANPRNQYIDFGSALNPFTQGANRRPYSRTGSWQSAFTCPREHRCPNNPKKMCLCDVIASPAK